MLIIKKGVINTKYKIGDKFQEQFYGMIYILNKSKISKFDFFATAYNGYTNQKMNLHNTFINESHIDELIKTGKIIKL